MERRSWTEDELIQAINLYCVTPFGRIHARNTEIIRLAQRINRTANAIALKMVNFAALDPTIDRKGMSNVSALDRKMWANFFNNIDTYLAELPPSPFGFSDGPQEAFAGIATRDQTEAIRSIASRRGQERFRLAVLASYNQSCAITGISDSRLLVASHIAPWAVDVGRRLDPRNGICLSATFDRAFDQGVIAISEDYRVLFSRTASEETVSKLTRTGDRFRLPDRFRPDPALLHEHRSRFGFA